MRRFLIPLLLAALPAQAIVMRHDREDRQYRALALPYAAVTVDMNLPGGAGTLIAPRWVLTAAHVTELMKAPHSVRVNRKLYEVKRIVKHPKDDIALVELKKAVRGVREVRLYRGDDENGRIVTFVGRGFAGDGKTGPVNRDRVLRGATNKVDKVMKTMLVFGFEEPPAGTELEGISGPGDSGGPALLERGGRLYILGVSSGQDSRAAGGKEGLYGVTEYYVRVSAYFQWIESSMK